MEKLNNKKYSNVRGFNYQPSYGSCGLEIWGEKFALSKIKKELELGKKYFPEINTIRLWLSHDAFLKNPEGFNSNFEAVLKVGEKLGLSFIPTLFNGWHSYPDFGGITPEQISYWGNGERFNDIFLLYLEEVVLPHRHDNRILLLDLCNEPFNSAVNSPEAKDIIFKWLQRIYQVCKKFGLKYEIGVGSVPNMESIKILEPISDVITFHPYYAWNAWVKEKRAFKKFLDEAVNFANKVNKPLLSTETGWGAIDDKKRAEVLSFELKELKKREIGFIAHLLFHTLVADGHKPQYGPVSSAGYMAFIEENGILRYGHEIFNKFCSEQAYFKGGINFLEEWTKKVIEKCKVPKQIEGKIINLYVPSGDMKYHAFWIRDFYYIMESGFTECSEVKEIIRLIAEKQSEKEKIIENGLIIPYGAIPDHINFDGTAVFFPGTYQAGENQGDGTYGFYPPHDNQYFFINIVHKYIEESENVEILDEEINGKKIIERMELAFKSYNIKEEMCMSDDEKFTVDWGFCDTVKKSGFLLFPSLLRYESSIKLSEIFKKIGNKEKLNYYMDISKKIKEKILKYFWHGSGFLLSATGIGKQKDIFGTLFAIYLGVLEDHFLNKSLNSILDGYLKETCIDKDGYVRHIPKKDDFSNKTSWEKTISNYGEYQNGGYWLFASGWYIFALSKIDIRIAKEYVKKIVEHIFKEWKNGAPYEWKNDEIKKFSGCLYCASICLPYKFIQKINFLVD